MKKIILISFLVLLIDQALKIYIKTHFQLGEDIKILDWFHIRFIENPGMAYGLQWGGFLGKIGLSIFRLILIAIMVVYIYNYSKKFTSWKYILPASLIMAGAIGNLIDSIFYGVLFDLGTTHDGAGWMGYEGVARLNGGEGYAPLFGGCVVDMFSFPIVENMMIPVWIPLIGGQTFSFFNYIFNIADSSITIGVLIWLIVSFSAKKEPFKK